MPIPEEESSFGRFLDRAPLPFGTSSATTPTVMATTHDDQGFLGAAVGQPGCTGCFICGAKDHDFRTCPRRSQKGGKGKGTGIHYAEASVFTVTMEDEPGDEVIPAFKSQGIVAGADLDGYAVLGTGATETVGSLPAIEQLMKVRYQQRGYPESVHVMDQPPKKFKSGNGETAFSSSYILLPQQLGDQEVHLGIYTLDVVGVPVLVGIKTLHRLGAVLGLAKFVVVFTSVDMARAIKLQRSPSGHALLDLRGDWLSGGCLVSELGKTLQPVLFSEEKGAESAYMVTESGTVPDHEVPCPVPDGSDRQCSCACVSYQSQTTGAPNDVDGQNVGSSNVSKPMRSLVTLLTLVALHGGPLEEGASFDCQGQGQEQTKDGTAASRLRPDGGRGPSRPTGSRGSLQGQPLPKDSVQPVCTVDRLPGLRSSDGVPCPAPTSRTIGPGHEGDDQERARGHRELPHEPRDQAPCGGELDTATARTCSKASGRSGDNLYQGPSHNREDQEHCRGGRPEEDEGQNEGCSGLGGRRQRVGGAVIVVTQHDSGARRIRGTSRAPRTKSIEAQRDHPGTAGVPKPI